MPETRNILIYGYGNPGRLDDGLGPALVAALEGRVPPSVTIDSDYQLVLEDAAQVAAHDTVLFVDAAVSGDGPFWLRRLVADRSGSGFTTHSVKPEALMAVAEDLLGRRVQGFVMGIRGYDFNEFGERLSARATDNLRAAIDFLALGLDSGDLPAHLERHAEPLEARTQ